ncbi:MAG TPA: hypothetical protein VL282_07215 [Tepidisphaeraceae bacterium]|jgi:hypothetical protein|nr:hypothetical protein [Tepidisphaeraceae bacterium]
MLTDPHTVEISDTLEGAAGAGAIVVDRAAIIVPQKLASSVAIRQHALGNELAASLNVNVNRERRKAAHFIARKKDCKVVPILLAARGEAVIAGAFPEDGKTKMAHAAFL